MDIFFVMLYICETCLHSCHVHQPQPTTMEKHAGRSSSHARHVPRIESASREASHSKLEEIVDTRTCFTDVGDCSSVVKGDLQGKAAATASERHGKTIGGIKSKLLGDYGLLLFLYMPLFFTDLNVPSFYRLPVAQGRERTLIALLVSLV